MQKKNPYGSDQVVFFGWRKKKQIKIISKVIERNVYLKYEI